MKILIINTGSSSIKFQLIQMPDKKVICSGMVERIGLDNTKIHYKSDFNNLEEPLNASNHHLGLEKISSLLLDKKIGVLQHANEIDAVGHRVVHGGNDFAKTTLINKKVKDKIKELFALAPLHNPPNLEGIEVAEKIFPKAKQIAVFDTAFHQTMPAIAYKYAIPNHFLDENQIRVYGFHGSSHKFVTEKAVDHLNKQNSKIISIHLGNGCSITAVENGKSIDHSLGFGPMNGLIMGTRSGDIDQSVIFYLVESLGYTIEEVNNILQKQSGMLGLTGFSDLREIEEEALKGNKECEMALKMNAYRIRKFIGSYTAIMNGLDAIIFTAGVGENSTYIRSLVCDNMDYIGLELDMEKNNVRNNEIREISSENSKVKILVIPTNEELEIAKESFKLLKSIQE